MKRPARAGFFIERCRQTAAGLAKRAEDSAIQLRRRKEKSLLSQAFKEWLGYEDSNLGMVESESTALPLGDTPTNVGAELSVKGRNKEPLTSAFGFLPTASSKWLGCRDSNPGMAESESAALPLGDTPRNSCEFYFALSCIQHARRFKYGGYDGNRTCDPSIMSAVL